jgi:hypothetical protein
MNLKSIAALSAVLLSIFFTHSLKAQAVNSIYSMYGVGLTIDNNFGVNRSMGGTGIAFQSGRSMNYSNPASYLGIFPDSFVAESGAFGMYNKSTTKNASQMDGDFNFNYLSASFYLKEYWSFSFGIVPFSSVDYEVTSVDQVGGELNTFEKTFKGTGGLYRVNLGNSFRVYKGLSVGFNTSYILGTVTQTETAIENDTFTGYEIQNQQLANSAYFDFGMQYSVKWKELLYTVGAIYGPDKKLNTTDDIQFTYNDLVSSLEPSEDTDLRIPEKYGVGISVNNIKTFRVGLDYEFNNWSQTGVTNESLDIINSNRYSVGAELFPFGERKSSWYKNIFYRFGANYKNTCLEFDNTKVDTKGITFGVGIPFGRTNIFNFSVEYGQEGTLTKGLVQNSHWGFFVNFSLHEFWQKRGH